ncbi:MAG: NAD(P)H-binding protein [Pelobium sp.]
MKRVAVIGATGLVGKPVTKALIAKGFDVTIIARDIEKARNIFPNTHIIYGDLEDKVSLFEALKGQEIVYLSLHISQTTKKTDFMPETDGLLHLFEAAKVNEIQRIAYLSSLVKDYEGQNCFNWWVFKVKQHAVQLLKGSGIPYTIFYPSNFMENFDKGDFKSGKRMNLAGHSKIKQYWISGDDYGKQVCKSFEILTDENREYVIQGPEAHNMKNAVKVFIKNYKSENLKITRIPIGILKFMGLFSPKVNYIYHILEALNNYPEKFQAQLSWDELGKPNETIEKYTLRIQDEK